MAKKGRGKKAVAAAAVGAGLGDSNRSRSRTTERADSSICLEKLRRRSESILPMASNALALRGDAADWPQGVRGQASGSRDRDDASQMGEGQQDDRAGPSNALAVVGEVGMTNAMLASQGVMVDYATYGLVRAEVGMDRTPQALMTWSHPKALGYYSRPTTRDAVARQVAEAIDQCGKTKEYKVAPVKVELMVFFEPHQDGNTHAHVIMVADTKTKIWAYLEKEMLNMFRAKVHVEVASGGRGGIPPTQKMLKYLIVPSLAKLGVDDTPFKTQGFEVPERILNERNKAYAVLRTKPAKNTEVQDWIDQNPDVDGHERLMDKIDALKAKNPADIKIGRLSRYVDNNIHNLQRIVNPMVERRNRRVLKDVYQKSWKVIMLDAFKSICQCSGRKLYEDLKMSVEWHDAHERSFTNSQKIIGQYAHNLCTDGFKDRQENIMIIGERGAGKTTVLNAFEIITPPSRVFTPSHESSTPFSGLRSHHILGCFQEFRIRENFAAPTLLLWLERAPNLKIDVKHEVPVNLPDGGPRCIFTTNSLATTKGWDVDDVAALKDRMVIIEWKRELPDEVRSQAARKKCRKCAIDFLSWCSPTLHGLLIREAAPQQHGRA